MQLKITQSISRNRIAYPNGIALVDQYEPISWPQFYEDVRSFAGALRKFQVVRGDRIAILSDNSKTYISLYWAIPWSGCVMVPLNTRLSDSEIADILTDCEAKLLLVDDVHLSRIEVIRSIIKDSCTIVSIGSKSNLIENCLFDSTHKLEPVEDLSTSNENPSAIFYTGGTTGRPKGVLLSPGGLIPTATSVQIAANIDSSSCVLHSGPLFHMAAGGLLYAAVGAGAKNIVVDRFVPGKILEIVERNKVTHVLWVPTMLEMILSLSNIYSYDLSSISRIMYGASPMPKALIERAFEVFPNAGFVQFYGMTEMSPLIAYSSPEDHTISLDRDKSGSVGRPGPFVEVKIVDVDGRDVPTGKVGEIIAKSPGVMEGYWQQPELTSAAIRNDFMYTGDAGYLDEDGYLYVVDRIKDMIISGGENIYSTEVENAIYMNKSIRECAVVGIPDDVWGEAVVAVVYSGGHEEVSAKLVIDNCRDKIAGYKCPKRVFISNAELPKTAAGKINKNKVREMIGDAWNEGQ